MNLRILINIQINSENNMIETIYKLNKHFLI